jgi:hypothetical protein
MSNLAIDFRVGQSWTLDAGPVRLNNHCISLSAGEIMQHDTPSEEDMLTIKEVQAALGISRTAVLCLGNSGRLSAVKIGGKLTYKRAEVTAERERCETFNKMLYRLHRDSQRRGPKAAMPADPERRRAVPHYDGETAAKAVELFDRGGGVLQAVVELKVTFDVANHMYESYKGSGPELYLSSRALTTIARWLGLRGWPTLAGIEQAIASMGTVDRDLSDLRRLKGMIDIEPRLRWEPRSGAVFAWISRPAGDTEAEPDVRRLNVTDVLKMTPEELELAKWTEEHWKRCEEAAAAEHAAPIAARQAKARR